MMNSDLTLGYDYDKWYGYGAKIKIKTDISPKTNSHILLCGMSGSGKSYATNILLARLCKMIGFDSVIYFADFKQDDQFAYLRDCPRYYPYTSSIEALDTVYEILNNRQSGVDESKHSVTLIWDEYIANMLYLQGINKKKADECMRKLSEILMLGRSLNVRMVVSCQRPDASAFPSGSRLNYGIIIIVGAPIRSIYEMLVSKEDIDAIGERKFEVGEGIVLLQGSRLEFIKIPLVHDEDKMKSICINALSK